MPRNPLNESDSFHYEQYLNSNPYREFAINKQHFPETIPISSHSNRLNPRNQSTLNAFDQLINNPKDSLTLNRNTYKLRIKSDLNIDTLKEIHLPQLRYYHRIDNHTNSNNNHTFNTIPLSSRTKPVPRQPIPINMTTDLKKTIINNKLNGIRGNALRVEKLDDLIKQTDNIESRLIHRPTEYLDNSLTSLANNRSINDHTLSKSFSLERPIKQPQILTEYQYNIPTLSRTPSQAYRYRIKEKINNIDQYGQRFNSFEQQSSFMNSHDLRIKESHEKPGKQLYVCNKLNINDSLNAEPTDTVSPLSKQPLPRFIIPFARPVGHFTSKSTDDLPRLAPLQIKTKHETKSKEQKIRKESFEQVSTYDEESLPYFNNTIKSVMSFTDLDDDLRNPPNTRINADSEEDK